MAEGGIHPVPNRGKRKWIYTATCFTCTAGLWVVLRFIISHYHLSISHIKGADVERAHSPLPPAESSTSWMEMEVGELLMSEPEPDDSGVVHEDTSIPLNPTSNWPEPCLTNYTHTKGEEVPVMDLVRAALAELANSSLFILQRDLQKSTWGGPGPLPKKRHTIDRSLLPVNEEAVTRLWPPLSGCAAVGNSGHLKLTNFGRAIDSHNFVLRLNQAPTKGYERWVGKRSTIRFINYSWLHKYAELITEASYRAGGRRSARGRSLLTLSDREAMKERLSQKQYEMERSRKARASGGGVASQHANMLKALARSRGSAAIESNRYGKYRSAPLVGSGSLQGQGMEVPLERDVTLVFRWQSGNTMEDTLNLIRIVKRARPDVQVPIVSSAFRETLRTLMAVYHKRLRCVSKIKPEGGDIPSSGLMAIFMLMSLCGKSVTLYGYGAASGASGGRKAVPYHYYTNLGERSWTTKASIHSFNTEQKLVNALEAHHRVTVCNERSDPSCGAIASPR